MLGTRITLTYPRSVYSGAGLGHAEELPSFARVHEAFVAAASGGPDAHVDGHVLVADPTHREALRWLEDHEPLALVPPPTRMSEQDARRYRWRASPVDPANTPFEPMSALGGPVAYLWPTAPDNVVRSLQEIAPEVTHVGRADSVVIARVDHVDLDPTDPDVLSVSDGRGPGRVLPVPARGRTDALVTAHAEATRPGRHGKALLGRQVPDVLATGALETALRPRRFVAAAPLAAWPYDEVWELDLAEAGRSPVRDFQGAARVAAAVGIHRALIRAFGADVPAFVTGRDGEAPLRGAGHLAVHLSEGNAGRLFVLLAVPRGVAEADRERLAEILTRPLRAGSRTGRRDTRWFTVKPGPTLHHAVSFWRHPSRLQRTEVPLVLEAAGGPRQGGWTIEDAVVCSVGYALRGVLEDDGLEWGTGWAFRRALVDHLTNERDVTVRARRVRERADRYLHRARPGELLVAADAVVDLGDLARDGGAFLALGRARHLGGGLLRPVVG